MKPLAVHHVSLNVSDVPEAVTFYTDILGLEVRTDRPDFGFGGAWLNVGDGHQQVHLIEGEVPPGKGQHFAMLVDDLEGVVAELQGRGLEVSEPKPVGTSRQSFMSDPAGNLIELHQVAGP